jgi:hypothetical protein
MSQLEVDKVIPQSGTTLTLGESGDTITIPSGATFSATLTAPIIDEINDNNGNEEIIFTTTTSAVNELTIANAATGNAPEIAATGDDTDIDLKLTPKGAGNLVLDGIEFPNADGSAGQALVTDGSGVLSFATPAGITLGTAVASTSGTSIDFTGIPAGVKRVTVMFSAVSTNGTSALLIQIGAGSVTTSGYTLSTGVIINATPAAFYVESTAGFIILNGDSANVFNGTSNIFNVASNTWTNNHIIGGRDASRNGGGSISLGGTLDRVRITTVNGTDTFDAGTINIMYE